VGFTEVADRVWVARYPDHDVNVSLVAGDRGLLVVDTHASADAARGVIDDIRALGAGEIAAVVNTHDHFDHHLGNGEFRAVYGDVPVHAHEAAAIDTADRTFSSALALDLGDRLVELVHPGRGHTAGDLVVRVQDADVVLAGDLVEESGPPAYGDDCFPLEWPLSLDLALGLVTPHTVVVPGHGAPVGREFAERQRDEIGVVAETIRDLATRGVPADQALAQADWPFDPSRLADAVRRGYEQLPRSQKRLPLV
jgi:glyoxylase-like metal-dependent hydrolase (beta-lactamase superfamily II)